MADRYANFLSQFASVYTSTTGSGGVAFGFNAAHVKLINDGAGAMFVDLQSTSGATTDDYQLSSGETLELRGVGAGLFGAAFKSSAASTAGPSIRVGAWG